MANTYTQIHIHFVFAVKFRKGLISNEWKAELYKYITEIIQSNDHKLLAINGIEDHIHIFVGMRPTQSISDLMKIVKQSSSLWINEKRFTQQKFQWQEGYGAFSHSKSQVETVIKYILNQEEHHKKETFKKEYLDMLQRFEIEYEEKYAYNELV